MLKHDTVEVRKLLSSQLAQAFEAFSDINKRVLWAVPKGQKIEYLKNDFSIGGIDIAKCGDPSAMNFKTIAYYVDIKLNKRVIFTESVYYKDTLLSVALNSLEFLSHKSGCEVKLTIQFTDLSGQEVKANFKKGWEAVLDNLKNLLIQTGK